MDVSSFDSPSLIKLSSSRSLSITRLPRSSFASSLQDAFVQDVSSLHSTYALSLSAPSNSLSFLNKSRLQLVHSIRPAHADTITGVQAPSYLSTHLGTDVLLSSGKDGLLKLWDTRDSYACVLQFDDRRGILSFDVSSDGLCIAAGTELKSDEAHLLFWDIRNPSAPTHISTSAHSDDITSLSFHPSVPHLLLSASTDGLLCTTDAREHDEDESGVQVGNWGCSIAKVGWTGAGSSGEGGKTTVPAVWAHSDMQTFCTWSDELDTITDFGDLRKPAMEGQWGSEYFIDAFWDSGDALSSKAGLCMWVGANNGDIALLRVKSAKSWKIERILSGAHTDVVRAITYDKENGILVTGGEDARVCAWSLSSTAETNVSATAGEDAMEIDEGSEFLPPSRGSKRARGDGAHANDSDAEVLERPKMSKKIKSETKTARA